MRLKKCPGCAKAIVESASPCEFCGFQDDRETGPAFEDTLFDQLHQVAPPDAPLDMEPARPSPRTVTEPGRLLPASSLTPARPVPAPVTPIAVEAPNRFEAFEEFAEEDDDWNAPAVHPAAAAGEDDDIDRVAVMFPAEAAAELAVDPDTEAEAEPAAQPEIEAEAELAARPDIESVADAALEAEAEAEADVDVEIEPEVERVENDTPLVMAGDIAQDLPEPPTESDADDARSSDAMYDAPASAAADASDAIDEAEPVDEPTEPVPQLAVPVAPAAPVAPARAARFGSQKVLTGLAGAAAAGIILVALMSVRGSASPGGAAAAPAPAPAAPTTTRLRPAVKTPRAVPVVTPKWTSNPGAWVGRERNSAAYEVAAIGKVQVWMRQVHPMLVVRCRAKSAEVFVFTDSAAKMEPQDGNHTVRFRLDDGAETSERWPDSAEHDALFAPDGGAFLRQLVQARSLQFGFSPHNADAVMATFDVTGLADHLAQSARQCGWKNP